MILRICFFESLLLTIFEPLFCLTLDIFGLIFRRFFSCKIVFGSKTFDKLYQFVKAFKIILPDGWGKSFQLSTTIKIDEIIETKIHVFIVWCIQINKIIFILDHNFCMSLNVQVLDFNMLEYKWPYVNSFMESLNTKPICLCKWTVWRSRLDEFFGKLLSISKIFVLLMILAYHIYDFGIWFHSNKISSFFFYGKL